MLSERFTQAVDYAREVHASQFHGGTDMPYLAHLLGVASLVLRYGGDEDQAIAGLLHDTVAQLGAHHAQLIRRQFGDRVADIVLASGDGSDEPLADGNSAEARASDAGTGRHAYLARLETASRDALLVCGCDQLHNARAIIADLRDPAVGARAFSGWPGGRDGALWFYRSVANCCARRGAPMARDLSEAVAAMAAIQVHAPPRCTMKAQIWQPAVGIGARPRDLA